MEGVKKLEEVDPFAVIEDFKPVGPAWDGECDHELIFIMTKFATKYLERVNKEDEYPELCVYSYFSVVSI